jgi:hypothetical protein
MQPDKLVAYAKSFKEDLTQEQKRAALALIKEVTGGQEQP